MTAYPAWTPASRPGIVPLHPLSFGTLLGRSFAALRHNPRVLLGFALVVQTLAYLVLIAAGGGIAFAAFSRLDTLRQGSDAYDTIMAGSIAITAVAAFVLGLAAGALGVIVQGVVTTEVARAALAEKPTLGALWRQVRPVAWRLLGYALMLAAALVLAFAAVAGGVFAIGTVIPAAGILLGILLVLAAIPLLLALSVKLLLVPPVIILEHATIRGAIARSWRLTRGRFWAALGVIVLIQLVFGAVAQLVTLPFSLLGTMLSSVIAPTGEADTRGVVGFIVTVAVVQVLSLLVQSVASIVEATAGALVYLDCRMRHEGLDLDLLAYVERRDAGATDLPDPYTQGIGRADAPRPAYAPYPGAPGMPYPGVAPTAGPGASPGPAAPHRPVPGGHPPPAPAAAAPAVPPPAAQTPAGATAPGVTEWTAPGSPGRDAPPHDPDRGAP